MPAGRKQPPTENPGGIAQGGGGGRGGGRANGRDTDEEDEDEQIEDEEDPPELAAAMAACTTEFVKFRLSDAFKRRAIAYAMENDLRGKLPTTAQIAEGADPCGPYDINALPRMILNGDATPNDERLAAERRLQNQIWHLQVQLRYLWAIWELTDGDNDSLEGFENFIFTLIKQGLKGSGARHSQRWMRNRILERGCGRT